MRVVLLSSPPVTLDNVEPWCGEDFCDGCGDCLYCFGDDPCYHNGMGSHTWYVSLEDVKKWRAEHGR